MSLATPLFTVLCAIFVVSLVIADIIGSKLFLVGPLAIGGWTIPSFVLSAGIIPFPLTFVLTDLINEFYGKKGARFVTFLGLGMAVYAALLLYGARLLPATPNSPIPQAMFETVFGLSGRMFIASLTAYLVGQLLDIQVFQFFKGISHHRLLWLRATGSTVVSQIVDSFIVGFIAFGGKLPVDQIFSVCANNYGIKFLVAIALTPLLYLGHAIIHGVLLKREADPAGTPQIDSELPAT